MFTEEMGKIKNKPRDLRNFGLAIGIIFFVLGAYFLFAKRTLAGETIVILGAALIIFGLLLPRALYWPQRVWMGLAAIMGWIMSRFILAVLFYLAVTPVGILTRALGKDFLELRRRSGNSYWHKREESFLRENYERQF